MDVVLLVEADPQSRDMLSRRLELRGYEVLTAVDAAGALRALEGPLPLVALLDLDMDGDPWALARRIRASPRTVALPLIGLTADLTPATREQALAAGCDDLVGRPIEIDRLLAMIGAEPRPAPVATPARRADVPADPAEPHARVLVVDDNPENLDWLARRLRLRGYAVEVASSGKRALALAEEGRFDIVLLDVMMPDVSGLEVLRHLRAQFSRAELPIVMVTAASGSDAVVQALSIGANDYITKPFEFDVVEARVRGLLATREDVEEDRRATHRVRDLARGATLEDRYRLEQQIGSGGCARVFAATQLTTGQQVAVKVLELSLEPNESEMRFAREMDVIAQLRHPHIIRLIDSGDFDLVLEGSAGDQLIARPYLVMDYLEGEPLSTRLERSKLDIEQTLDIALPVIAALAAAHDAGVVHRDIKPANIFLTTGPGGRVHPIVLDFGIAKYLDRLSTVTSSTGEGEMLGTPRYLSPEQARGRRDDIDGRSDQFSLALVLLECLTGRSAIARGQRVFRVLYILTIGKLPDPRERAPELPEPLADTLSRALSREPEARFPSIRELGLALLPFASEAAQAIWGDELGQQS